MFPCSSIPRPEYPRPDRQRGLVEGVDWLNLNGPWQFRFDLHRRGEEERWFAPGGPDWREQIIVPFCWESLAAWGEGDAAGNENYYSTRCFINPVEVTRENHRSAPRFEVGWYRRHVTIPRTRPWHDKRIILTIGAADFFTDCWCNGVHLGRHEGGYVPIEFDLTDALELAAGGSEWHALLVVRVEDPMENREQPVGKQWGWYTTTSGIWQTVFVEPRSPTHIDSFRILPDIDERRARFEITCAGATDGNDILVEILPPDAPPHQLLLRVEDGQATGDAAIHPLTLWDTSAPHLYHVVFRLRDAGEAVLDEVRGYFGMRKISTTPAVDGDGPAMLCVNNRPIYLRGALYQSYHPAGVYTAPDVKTLHDDIHFAREAGFDFLRIHIKLDDPLVLHCADTLGILLMQDFPNFGEGGDTLAGRRRFEETLRLGIRRDFNHPSIIAWCIFNETWGFGGQTELMKLITPHMAAPDAAERPVSNLSSFEWVHEMWQLAKSLDHTRLVEDMSVVVWEHLAAYGHVDTDVNSWHFYIDDYERARAHISDVVAKTYRGSSFNFIEGRQQGDAPLINSEYGGVGALDGDRDVSWSFKFLTNELRRHPQLSAYIFTELTDVEWEYNGFLNYDRTPKEFGYAPTIVNQGDTLPIDSPPICRLDPGAPVAVNVMSSHFSRRRREQVTLHWLYSGIDTLGTEHPSLLRGRSEIAFAHHRVELARRLEFAAPDLPMLCTLSVAAVTADGQPVAANFIQHLVGRGLPPKQEHRNNALVLRHRVQDWQEAAWEGPLSTREEAWAGGACFGQGTGFFQWAFADEMLPRVQDVRRVRVLVEAASHREDTPQTDSHAYPTNLEILLNGVPIHRGILPNHPHDSRGALSYLRGGRGAHGYLIRATVEATLLERVIAAASSNGAWLLRCEVPPHAMEHGGLTIYEADCGRYPIGPTIVFEWEQS